MLSLTSSVPVIGEEKQQVSRITRFIQRFGVIGLLQKAGITKTKGFSVECVIDFLLTLVFIHKNLYRTMVAQNNIPPFAKDTAYRLLNDPRWEWIGFLLTLGATITAWFKTLTSEQRVKAIIFDDSAYVRDRSKKVELLARVKDHVTGRYFKGFRMLTAGWTDGASFVPLSFALLSSSREKNRLYEQGPDVPKGSHGETRRKQAIQPATAVMLEMFQQILTQVQDFQYVLFDSWFSWPDVIKGICQHQRHVICMLKDMPHIVYGYEGKEYRLSDLYQAIGRQTRNKAYISSVLVSYYGLPARVVFVRNRNGGKREWLALLTTDTAISEEEVIRVYGLRWDIEVFFKACKSFLGLAKECQSRTYDAMVAHTAMVFLRHMLLTVENREQNDSRAHGELFYLYCDEVADLEFSRAFFMIIDLLTQTLRENLFLSDAVIGQLIDSFMDKLPLSLKNRLCIRAA
ncbi:transposase [Heliomicrobium modesticaldum]|uniref:IS4 family transposase n=1 Tax=Heliomicrobium modesticaldum TaxID=35701 RepID=UPI001650A900|nr:transposase [Heliomicrobium modesticaldum]